MKDSLPTPGGKRVHRNGSAPDVHQRLAQDQLTRARYMLESLEPTKNLAMHSFLGLVELICNRYEAYKAFAPTETVERDDLTEG